jgi:uroporphyrinogen decarboxylase
VPFILEAVSIVAPRAAARQAVIGFCGGPVHRRRLPDRGASRAGEFLNVKRMMYAEPATARADGRSSPTPSRRYVAARCGAGADVIQRLRLSGWERSRRRTTRSSCSRTRAHLAAVDCPTIHFGTGTATLLESMRDAGGGRDRLDWRIPLDWGWQQVGDERGVQGNLDGAVLFGAVGSGSRPRPRTCSPRAAVRLRHIFNLATGSCPTPIRTCSDACAPSCTTRPPACPREQCGRPAWPTGRRTGSKMCRPTTRTSAAAADQGPSSSRTSSRATAGSGSRTRTR